MSNPFKAGDKLVVVHAIPWCYKLGRVVTVSRRASQHEGSVICEEVYDDGSMPCNGIASWNFRAAIAGVDYDVPEAAPEANSGHLADGSSVQKHSAGGLYPCVLVWRDKKGGPDTHGKYDVGVITPKNAEPLWFKCRDDAVSVAAAIKAVL